MAAGCPQGSRDFDHLLQLSPQMPARKVRNRVGPTEACEGGREAVKCLAAGAFQFQLQFDITFQ